MLQINVHIPTYTTCFHRRERDRELANTPYVIGTHTTTLTCKASRSLITILQVPTQLYYKVIRRLFYYTNGRNVLFKELPQNGLANNGLNSFKHVMTDLMQFID